VWKPDTVVLTVFGVLAGVGVQKFKMCWSIFSQSRSGVEVNAGPNASVRGPMQLHQLHQFKGWRQAKFLTSAKFLTCCCLSVVVINFYCYCVIFSMAHWVQSPILFFLTCQSVFSTPFYEKWPASCHVLVKWPFDQK